MTRGENKRIQPRLKNPVQKRSLKTRKRIVDAAKDLFAETGFEETNTNLIAARAGVSIGSVYAHFKDKWEIFIIFLDEFSQNVHSRLKTDIDAILVKNPDDVEKVVDWLIRKLYRLHRLNGKLNLEIAKFSLKDERAARLRAKWDEEMMMEIQRLLTPFGRRIAIKNIEAGITVAFRSGHEVFQYIYKNSETIDEDEILNEYISMIQRYVVATPSND